MLLTVDIGNTNITVGAYDGDTLCMSARLSTDRMRTADQYAIELRDVMLLRGVDRHGFGGAIISSVVPELTATISNAVLQIVGHTALVVGPGIKTGLNILTDNPAQVGSDLVACSVAAGALYPLPCLVIDLGTATKISALDATGAFCGCAIASGVGISLEALSKRTSQLPSIPLDTPKRAIGTNTVDSMQSGVVFGTAAMLDGLCEKMKLELSEPVQSIVATGGLSQDIIKSCYNNIVHDPCLVLYGLKLIYERNQHKR